MPPENGEENAQNFTFFAHSLWAQALMVYDNHHEQYHFIERHVGLPMNMLDVLNNYGLFQNSRCEINYR